MLGFYVRTVEDIYVFTAVDDVVCIDTTGAVDSFAAGFMSALLAGRSVIECAKEGNRYGAKAVQYVGATEWLRHEILDGK